MSGAETGHTAALRSQLGDALQAMELLAAFSPRLAGPLAAGHADLRLPLVIHVCAEHPDDVHHTLAARNIPTRTFATRLHVPREGAATLPGIGFYAGGQELRILVFSEAQFRQRLRVGDETEPSPRLAPARVRALLATLPS